MNAMDKEPDLREIPSNLDDGNIALLKDKSRLRRVLMITGIVLVCVVSLAFYLTGGRYVSSDNSYIRAAQLMVSTDVSGIVSEVNVREGQRVKAGTVLFRLDKRPFEIALQNAKASLAASIQELESLKANYRRDIEQIEAQSANTYVARTTLDRYGNLIKENAISKTLYDQARAEYLSSQAILASLKQSAQVELAKLSGNPQLPADQSTGYIQAKARVDEIERQLEQSVVKAPFDGIVAKVDSLQPGILVVSGLSAFSTTSAVGLISEKNLWIESNLKETDLTYIHEGQPVSVTVDAYPGCTWKGNLQSISAASGASFSVLPSQNASGNWVKVVQRIPVRVELTKGDCDVVLRAGMSTVISIDTGHRRWYRLLNS